MYKNYTTRPSFFQHRRVLAAGLLLVIIAGTLLVFWLHHNTNSHRIVSKNTSKEGKVDYSPAKPSDNTANDQRKGSSGTVDGTTLNSTSTTSTGSAHVTITRAYIDNVDKEVQVGTIVSGATSGSCTLTATKSGQAAITATATISQNVNTYSCGLFNVSFSKFPVAGDWHISVTVSTDAGTATGQWSDPVTIPERQ